MNNLDNRGSPNYSGLLDRIAERSSNNSFPSKYIRIGAKWAWENRALFYKAILVAAVAAATIYSGTMVNSPKAISSHTHRYDESPIHYFVIPPHRPAIEMDTQFFPNGTTCDWLLHQGARENSFEVWKRLQELPKPNTERENELIEQLEGTYESTLPGQHTFLSPVTGNRAHEMRTVVKALVKQEKENNRLLEKLEDLIYTPGYCYIIPIEKRIEAEKISQEMFRKYISKYVSSGFTEANIVNWNSNYLNNHNLHAGFSRQPWCHFSSVSDGYGSLQNTYNGTHYSPTGVVAIHELMHAEETEPCEYGWLRPGVELMTSLRTIILLDQIYKEIYQLPMDKEVDYGKNFPLGKIANFYRVLESRFNGDLSRALTSDASIKWLEANI